MDEASAFPEPNAMRRRRPGLVRRLLRWLWRLVLGLVIVSVTMVVVYRFVPPPITLTELHGVLEGDGLDRSWMSLDRIDPNAARAAIAAEDDLFCRNHGFDFEAIAKAAEHNAEGKRLRGGSTISQQTAKNVFLWQGRSYVRKALEAWFTVLIEAIWGKHRIMEMYLNVAQTGIGTFGVNAGAQRYFHHDASHLSALEASRMAAILPLPMKRGVVAPKGYTARYGGRIASRMGQVHRAGLDHCVR